MLYHTNKRLMVWSGRYLLIKKILLTILLIVTLLLSASCTLLTKPLDHRTGFSNYLAQVENNIQAEEWDQAKIAWKELKPLMQLDVDHDYINNIEDDFIKLDAYLDTKDKSNSLASILLIKNTWENIGSL